MKVQIGDIFNIGIGYGETANCEVKKIEKDRLNGDQAVLEMIEFDGPLQRISVASLEEMGN